MKLEEQLPDELSVLRAATIIEGILAAIALFGLHVLATPVPWNISFVSTGIGVCGAVALFVVNFSLLWIADRKGILVELTRFRDEVARPLANSISPSNAIALSILAGLCEELFFRGFLQPNIGVLLTGVLFSLLHFGPRIRQWQLLAGIYLAVSLCFSGFVIISDSLWAAVVAHSLYDALVFLRLKSR